MRHPLHLLPLSPSPPVLVDRGGVGGRREALAATGDLPSIDIEKATRQSSLGLIANEEIDIIVTRHTK